MKAIIFSDLHLTVWSKHNENNKRLRAQKKVVTQLVKMAYQFKVPLFFAGDWYHMPEGLTNGLLSETLPWMLDLFNTYPIKAYGINGNHDFEEQNHYDRRSPGYITTLANCIENFTCLDFDSVEIENMVVHGIPYVHGNKDYPEILNGIKPVLGKVNILMNHCDYAGQKDVGDIIVGKGENINEGQLKKFALVWSGHIHRPGAVRNNIYSIGSPVQTRTSDMDNDFGYWTVSDHFEMEFHVLDDTPKFRYYVKESDKDNDFDLWIKKPIPIADIVKKLGREIDLTDKVGIIDAYIEDNEIDDIKKQNFLRAQIW